LRHYSQIKEKVESQKEKRDYFCFLLFPFYFFLDLLSSINPSLRCQVLGRAFPNQGNLRI
jgi:hypothetical protein